MNVFLIVVAAFFISSLHADTITVKNRAPDPIWVGFYYVKANLPGFSVGPAARKSDLVMIPAGQSAEINRPSLKLKVNREVIFSDQKYELKDKLSAQEYRQASKVSAGIKYGSLFHVTKKENVLRGYNDLEWKIVRPVLSVKEKAFETFLKKLKSIYSKQNKYALTQARIRRGESLADQELEYLEKRLPKTKLALEKVLNEKLDDSENLRIAVCMSGGGMRAATTAEGLFEGLQEIGLLDALTYAAGLSGSTWFLSSFTQLGLPIQEYSKHFVDALSMPHIFNPMDVLNAILKKKAFNQTSGLIDVYGVFLAHTFFHNLKNASARQKITLSDSQGFVENANCPFPLYTAIKVIENSKRWLTFTPYEMGCDDLKFNLPIWSFGRRFVDGKSIDYAPEAALGFLMGIWGSAGSGSIQNMLHAMGDKDNKKLFNIIDTMLLETGVGQVHVAGVSIFNPLFGVDDSELRNLKRVTLMDAGYDYNLPVPPLLKKERAVDIIIVMDASANVYPNAPAMQKAVSMIKKRNIPFPDIDLESITSKQVSAFFDDEDSDAPAVIFLAPVKNDKFSNFDPEKLMGSTYATTKFIYKANDVKKMINLIKQNIVDNKELFYKIIRQKIEQKRG